MRLVRYLRQQNCLRSGPLRGVTHRPYPATSPSKLFKFFDLSSNNTITYLFDRVAQVMDKLKERLNKVETSIRRVNASLCEMRAWRRLPFYIPSSPSQTYQYLSMKAAHEIRLLYLEPGSSKSHRLSCSLRIVPLSKTPIYEALSYTWGKPGFPASISCFPGGQLCITENLSVALCHLRPRNRIWML